MKTTLKLKNFRIFDQIGTSLDITPITFLTGCKTEKKLTLVNSNWIFPHIPTVHLAVSKKL